MYEGPGGYYHFYARFFRFQLFLIFGARDAFLSNVGSFYWGVWQLLLITSLSMPLPLTTTFRSLGWLSAGQMATQLVGLSTASCLDIQTGASMPITYNLQIMGTNNYSYLTQNPLLTSSCSSLQPTIVWHGVVTIPGWSAPTQHNQYQHTCGQHYLTHHLPPNNQYQALTLKIVQHYHIIIS